MKKLITLIAVFAVVFMSANVMAGKKGKGNVLYDADVTSNVIMGTGIGNGWFTIARKDGVEIGLRARSRFPKNGQYHLYSNGDGTYSLDAANACLTVSGGFSWAWCVTTPVWSFDWSINTDFDDSTGMKLSDFVYNLKMDADPGNKKKFTTFDPIWGSFSEPAFDHQMGDNLTAQSAGTKAVGLLDYFDLLDTNNLAQNSWNYEFFNELGTTLADFNPEDEGIYDICLEVREAVKGKKVTELCIQVITSAP